MPTAEFIRDQLQRLGAKRSIFDEVDAIKSLVQTFEGFEGSFDGTTQRYRSMLKSYGITRFNHLNDVQLEDEMPLLTALKFAGPAGFFDGWSSDFPKATSDQTPFASDEYYYYLLVPNEAKPFDPVVVAVDSEEPNEAPSPHYNLTVGKLLASVQRAEKPA